MPMAQPADNKIKPILEPNFSLSIFVDLSIMIDTGHLSMPLYSPTLK